MEKSGLNFLKKNRIQHELVYKKNYLEETVQVYKISVDIADYERYIAWIEQETKHRVMLYNADIPPEQQYLYKKGLRPGMSIDGDDDISLTKCVMALEDDSVILNDKTYSLAQLKDFVDAFNAIDPDVIIMRYAFANLPKLEELLIKNNLTPPFHRWDSMPIRYRGGKTFFSYGNIVYKDFAIRLKGRLLVDSTSIIGDECDIEGILELCRLTGARFQQIASRSYGAIFQHALTRILYEKDYLIPYKEKPVDQPMSMLNMLTADSAGHRFDAKTGYHEHVAEIDFSSMFPWIIYNKNISAETILKNNATATKVPGLPIYITQHPKGIIPQAIKPLIDKRMEYKKNPTTINHERIKALKYVLVTAYGYLRFREFKLGIATSHMAICAYARDILLTAARMAEERGFTIVHGIVDSLFIKKHNIQDEEVRLLCKDIESIVNIPVCFEGIFKWIIFLPSINNIYRPLPATYYGVFRSGTIKCRGIESRQRKIPQIVRMFQQRIIEDMALHNRKEILLKVPEYCRNIRTVIEMLNKIPAEHLAYSVRVSKTGYDRNIPQKIIIKKYLGRGIKLYPGQTIKYIHQKNRVVLPDEYNGMPDKEHYRRLLIRALFNILQPLGITKLQIIELSGIERQTKLVEYMTIIKQVSILFNESLPRLKLSEKIIRKKLEKQGYIVWRGGSINILRNNDVYPNVEKKYSLLYRLMDKYHPGILEELQYICHVHHGMPDFIIYKNGKFRFIECKLGYEQLSAGQIKCIQRLALLGFHTELYKLIESQTKNMIIDYNILTGDKLVIEKQLTIT